MTAKWQAGTTYAPGALVIPTANQQQPVLAPANPGFETGDLTGWSTADSGRWAVVSSGAYSGSHCLQVSGSGLTQLVNATCAPIKVGQHVSVSCRAKITNAGTDDADFQVVLVWYDDAGTQLSYVPGSEVNGKGGFWTTSTASGTAPANAASFGLTLSASPGNHGATIALDEASFSYAVPTIPKGLVYKATQAAPGKSASTEPTWPGDLTTAVTDNQVTWQGVIASQIVWQATPISTSGGSEPTWPIDVGGQILDGTANWTTTTPIVTDAKCPHSAQVLIAAEKVFAGDTDVTRYSATANPLDWSTVDDAGFIAHGMSAVQETSITALALYRGNIALFTASCLQLWKADPDPTAIVILDTVESVGSRYARGAVPVAQDVFFTTDQGIRSISVSASQQAMGEGDIGNPMDAVVRALVGPEVTPLAAFFPNLGQSLFFFGDQVVVLFQNKLAKMTGWALYQLPISVTDVALLDGDVYLRDATDIYWFQEGNRTDYGNSFPVVLEWQFLDFGTPGTSKTFLGVSQESDASGTLSAAYDIQAPSRRTGEKRLPQASEAFLSLSFVAKQAAFRWSAESTAMTSFTRLNVYLRDGGAL